MSVEPRYNDRQAVKRAVYGDVKRAVKVAVDKPSEHIAVDGDSVDAEDPRVFLNASMTDTSRGLHDRRLLEIQRSDGAIEDIIYAKRTQLSFDCSIASKTVGTADRVANAIQTVFDAYDNRQLDENDLTAADPPIHDVSVADSSPQNDNQRFGEVLTVMVEYTERQAHSTISEPPSAVSNVTIDFEVGATGFDDGDTQLLPDDSILSGESYTVPDGQSIRIRGPYTVEGTLVVDGIFVTTEPLKVTDSGTVTGDGRILVTEQLSFGEGFRDAIVRPKEV